MFGKYFLLSFVLLGSVDDLTSNPNNEEVNSTLNVIKITEPIKLSGKLDNPAWLLAPQIELNY
ncbi:MAG: hypothetical protein V1720_10955, partial [bacterium]